MQQIAERVARALERMGLMQRDAESAWLDLPPVEDADAMCQLLGSSVTCRIAVGPQAGQFACRTPARTPVMTPGASRLGRLA